MQERYSITDNPFLKTTISGIYVLVDDNNINQISDILDLAKRYGYYLQTNKYTFIKNMIDANYQNSYINLNKNGLTYYGSRFRDHKFTFNFQELYKVNSILKFGVLTPSYEPRRKKN